MGIVSGLSFRFQGQVVLKSHRVFEAISIEMLRKQTGTSSFGEPVIFWENMEPYTRISSVFRLVAATKGYSLLYFDCTKQQRYVISP